MRVMMVFGMFVFSISTTAYDNMKRQLAWRHPANSRVGARAGRQFLGVGDETITLSGITYAEIAPLGRLSLKALEAMGNTGRKYLLIGGDFDIYGQFVLEELGTTKTHFFPDGTARKIEFDLKLTRADDNNGILLGVLSTVANKVLTQ